MRRLLASLALLVFLAGCSVIPQPSVAAKRPAYLDAVRPMQVQVVEQGMSDLVVKYLKEMGATLTVGSFQNVCTMSAINREKGLWVTAGHCVAGVGAEGRWVDEQPLTVVFVNYVTDIAVVKAEQVVPKQVLRASFDAISFEQPILIVGHPFGYDDVFVTKGTVANPHATAIDRVPFMLFNCTAAPGNSGSPVLNLKGEIVSILQIGWGRSFSPVSGGITTDNLKAIEPFLPSIER